MDQEESEYVFLSNAKLTNNCNWNNYCPRYQNSDLLDNIHFSTKWHSVLESEKNIPHVGHATGLWFKEMKNMPDEKQVLHMKQIFLHLSHLIELWSSLDLLDAYSK